MVAAAITAKSGAAVASAWLADSLEIAEVHVHPDYHRRGIGRSLVLGLAEGRLERTAVLSTQDANSPARPALPQPRLHRPADRLRLSWRAGAVRGHGRVLPLRPTRAAGVAPSRRA